MTKDEGGRYTPFMDNYRPQLFLRTADITVGLHWPEGTADAAEKMAMPGDNVEMVCELHNDVAAEVGTRCVSSLRLRMTGRPDPVPSFLPSFLLASRSARAARPVRTLLPHLRSFSSDVPLLL